MYAHACQPCLFYSKTCACRHGSSCDKKHVHIKTSNTIVLRNIVPRVSFHTNADTNMSLFLDTCYEDIARKLSTYGRLRRMIMAENQNHLFGNVYAEFANVSDAEHCHSSLVSIPYAGRAVQWDFCEFSRATVCVCQQSLHRNCARGAGCNYVHPYMPSPRLQKSLREAIPGIDFSFSTQGESGRRRPDEQDRRRQGGPRDTERRSGYRGARAPDSRYDTRGSFPPSSK